MNFKTTIALVVLLVIGGAVVLFTRASAPTNDSNDSDGNSDPFGGPSANEAEYVLDPQPEEDELVRVARGCRDWSPDVTIVAGGPAATVGGQALLSRIPQLDLQRPQFYFFQILRV